MQWSDVVAAPDARKLRQFAGLCLIVFGGLAVWRLAHGQQGTSTMVAGALALVGIVGLAQPMLVRWVYTGWMVVAFPIGWTVSRLILGLMFFGVFTPLATAFRLSGRDQLDRRRRPRTSYWAKKPSVSNVDEYFRQV